MVDMNALKLNADNVDQLSAEMNVDDDSSWVSPPTTQQK